MEPKGQLRDSILDALQAIVEEGPGVGPEAVAEEIYEKINDFVDDIEDKLDKVLYIIEVGGINSFSDIDDAIEELRNLKDSLF